MEEEVEDDEIEGVELLFLTNNYVAEAVYYLGNSRNKDIFELMIWLVYLDLRDYFRLHVL